MPCRRFNRRYDTAIVIRFEVLSVFQTLVCVFSAHFPLGMHALNILRQQIKIQSITKKQPAFTQMELKAGLFLFLQKYKSEKA